MHLAINGWFWDRPTTGSGQYLRHLVEGLESLAADLRISVVLPREGPDDDRGSGPSPPSSLTLTRTECPRTNFGKLFFEQIAFPRACADLRAGLAHVPYWAPPLRSPAPLVVTIHDVIPLILPQYRGGALQQLYTALVSATSRRAQSVLTDSEAARRDILARLDLAPGQVHAIPLAAADWYHPNPSDNDGAIRGRYGLPDRYVLYLGGFDARKNLNTVVAAYGRVGPTVGATCPLVIAGRLPDRDTSFTPDPRRIALEEHIDERLVHFSGFVKESDKPALYRGAVALLFPSLYEGFGLPPLEALACGTPVIGSDVASLPEVIGEGGVLVPPYDVGGMARALTRLITDRDYRIEMMRRALDQAARFSWDRTARATLRTYRDTLN